MKTKLNSRQYEIFNDNIAALFSMARHVFFADEDWRDTIKGIPQQDDITFEQLDDYHKSYIVRISERSVENPKVILGHIHVALLSRMDDSSHSHKKIVSYAVVTKNKQ